MDKTILEWLLDEKNPEVRLRTLTEYKKLPGDDEHVSDCKRMLLQSKVYERGLKKLKKEKSWDKYDAILAFAEWGLTREDIGEDIDRDVFELIERTGFKLLCGEPLLLRNLVKLGYCQEEIVKSEVESVLRLIKDDGGFMDASMQACIHVPGIGSKRTDHQIVDKNHRSTRENNRQRCPDFRTVIPAIIHDQCQQDKTGREKRDSKKNENAAPDLAA